MGLNEENLSLYLKHRRELLEYASKIVGDRARGEDVVQEAFIRMQSASVRQEFVEPLAYLRRVIRNLAIDLLRRSAAEAKRFRETNELDNVAEDRPYADRVVESRDDLRIVLEALAELPERTRIAVEMHRFDGAKLKDIAAHLNISTALAHSLVFEGLAHCRRCLFGKQ